MTPAGRLLAEVRYGATAHVRATKRSGAWWFSIRLGKRRMITCDCGGAVQDRPHELTYEDSWGGCSHIVALYKGHVTMDEREYQAGKVEEYRVSYSRSYSRQALETRPHFVRLTKEGEARFIWRWAALKL